jgi:hypothetical protein
MGRGAVNWDIWAGPELLIAVMILLLELASLSLLDSGMNDRLDAIAYRKLASVMKPVPLPVCGNCEHWRGIQGR